MEAVVGYSVGKRRRQCRIQRDALEETVIGYSVVMKSIQLVYTTLWCGGISCRIQWQSEEESVVGFSVIHWSIQSLDTMRLNNVLDHYSRITFE